MGERKTSAENPKQLHGMLLALWYFASILRANVNWDLIIYALLVNTQ